MAFIEVATTSLSPEFVAAANLFTELAKDLTPEQKQKLAERFFEITEPFHRINVVIAANVASFVGKLLGIKPGDVKPADIIVAAKITASWRAAEPTKIGELK